MSVKRTCMLLLLCILGGWMFASCTPEPDTTQFPENKNFRVIGSFTTVYPSYLYDDKARETDPDDNLILTSFAPLFHTDHVSSISNLEATVNYLLDKNLPVAEPVMATLIESTAENQMLWPNEAHSVPEELEAVLGFEAMTISHGFLVPVGSIQDGAVLLLNVDTGKTQRLSQDILDYPEPGDSNRWFYHYVFWHDMNGDGLDDIVTARAHHGTKTGKLVWLEQPATNPGVQRWNEWVIGDGPDVSIVLHDIDGDDQEEIIATELYNKRLSVWWKVDDDPYAPWAGRVVDPDFGAGFGLSVTDLNNDGVLDLLATNHSNHNPDDPEDPIPSSVFAYEFPVGIGAYQTEDWTRHVLLTDIETLCTATSMQAAPGRATAFHPNVNDTGFTKPWIHINGDGSMKTHILEPQYPDDPTDWTYKQPEHITLIAEDSITGQTAIKDVNGDGYVELFIPVYYLDKIFIFTFAPETPSGWDKRRAYRDKNDLGDAGL